MKAILTKVLPATNTKPSRIKAYTEGGNSLTLSWDAVSSHGENQGQSHLKVAVALAKKMNWPDNLIGGGTPDGYAFVFTDSYIRARKVQR